MWPPTRPRRHFADAVKGAGMADQARSQVLLDLSRLEADPDGSYQELAPNWLEAR